MRAAVAVVFPCAWLGASPARALAPSEARLDAMARYFQAGRTELELVQGYASGDLAVLVVIERQRAEVGGLPEQDWSLRVTLVYRREAGEWRLAHRHADPSQSRGLMASRIR